MFFHDSKAHYLRSEQENFLLGGDLLIIPKWTEDGAIPEGNWRDVSINGIKIVKHINTIQILKLDQDQSFLM